MFRQLFIFCAVIGACFALIVGCGYYRASKAQELAEYYMNHTDMSSDMAYEMAYAYYNIPTK